MKSAKEAGGSQSSDLPEFDSKYNREEREAYEQQDDAIVETETVDDLMINFAVQTDIVMCHVLVNNVDKAGRVGYTTEERDAIIIGLAMMGHFE